MKAIKLLLSGEGEIRFFARFLSGLEFDKKEALQFLRDVATGSPRRGREGLPEGES